MQLPFGLSKGRRVRTHRGPVTRLSAPLAVALAVVGVPPSASATAPKRYKNCTALNRAYPHGVGRPGARDKTSGTPVTNFAVSKRVYEANRGSDRDRDGIACEKA